GLSTTYFSLLSLHDALPIFDLFCQDNGVEARVLTRRNRFAAEDSRHYTYAAFFAWCACLARCFVVDLFFAPPVFSKLCCKTETRSEEHTSELQSRSDLVCRL